MMVGTLLLNFWAALAAFTFYFLIMFQKPESPFSIIIGSFIFAIIGFVAMFIIRYLIGYILYTPEDNIEASNKDENKSNTQASQQPKESTSSFEMNDSSSGEIAKVVRTMMNS
ncbi:hypothetical protein [Ureibacillus acetophenoni]|uniref:Uncharacterized protein n=1 Tax=Ureibacillus acetophenoni TaxID=614649 RepID=A0A285U0Z1_9BACL|nr:hypothetical protein [Ureibacillus acetophenoni]SOC35575.1 hypothetical protein SAMN05877842_101496 [Ureibacillus acetophenoni]